MRPAGLLIAVACLLSASTGCGDDDVGTRPEPGARSSLLSSSAAPIAKDDYLRRAAAICAGWSENDYLPALRRYMRRNPTPALTEEEATAAAAYAAVAPGFEVQIADLGRLGAPPGDEETIESFLAEMKRAVERLERRSELALDGDIEKEFRRARQIAREYGIANCGGG